jgi:hypothetical protein
MTRPGGKLSQVAGYVWYAPAAWLTELGSPSD